MTSTFGGTPPCPAGSWLAVAGHRSAWTKRDQGPRNRRAEPPAHTTAVLALRPASLCSGDLRSTLVGVPQEEPPTAAVRACRRPHGREVPHDPSVSITAKVPLAAQPRHLCDRPANHFDAARIALQIAPNE